MLLQRQVGREKTGVRLVSRPAGTIPSSLFHPHSPRTQPGTATVGQETFASLLLLEGRHFLSADIEQRREQARQATLPPARGMNVLINPSPWEMDSS